MARQAYHLEVSTAADLGREMWLTVRSLLAHEGVAIVSVLVATVATWTFWQQLDPTVTPLFLAAVTISGWIGGLRGGLTAAALSTVSAAALSLSLDARHDLGLSAAVWTGSFLLVAILTGALNGARQRAEQLLNERDLRLQLLSSQLPAGLWATDTELRVTSMFGAGLPTVLRPGDVHLSEVFIGAGAEAGRAALAAHRGALEGEPGSYEVPLRGRVYQSHVEPLHDPEGRIIGVVGVALDITSRKRAEERLRYDHDRAIRHKQEAEAVSKAKDQFLAMLSHELRTPLTPALAAASTLEEEAGLPPPVRADLATIRRNIELEAILIDDLLDLTRITRGKLKLTRQAADAHAAIRDALEICDQDLRQKRIGLTLELSAKDHVLYADVSRLQQVFWNLLKNAVKFTPEGGRIEVRTWNRTAAGGAEAKRNLILIEIRDSGIGIEPDVLPRIFDAFEQGRPSITSSYGGLGLGLAICKALVEAHGGRISAESEGRDRGACFRLEFEISPEAGAAAGAIGPQAGSAALSDQPQSSAISPGPPASIRILLVEDHADTRRLLARLLGRMGHIVTTAGSVAAALEVFRSEPVELLISDLSLPDGNGLELMGQLQQACAGQGPLKAIALSGHGMEEDVRRCQEAGFARHLTKPVNLQILQQTIVEVAGLAPGLPSRRPGPGEADLSRPAGNP